MSFIVTDLIDAPGGAGDAVGTLGFADELLALLACPVWGVLSDRIGVRAVSSSDPLRCLNSDELGLCYWLSHHWYIINPVCSIHQCVPAITPWKTLFQSGSVCCFNHGNNDLAVYDFELPTVSARAA